MEIDEQRLNTEIDKAIRRGDKQTKGRELLSPLFNLDLDSIPLRSKTDH